MAAGPIGWGSPMTGTHLTLGAVPHWLNGIEAQGSGVRRHAINPAQGIATSHGGCTAAAEPEGGGVDGVGTREALERTTEEDVGRDATGDHDDRDRWSPVRSRNSAKHRAEYHAGFLGRKSS